MDTHQFCWTAQIHSILLSEGFAAGSAPSTILVNVAYVHYGEDASAASLLEQPVAVTLGKSLRRMMRGYLDVGDWIRIVGRWKLAAGSQSCVWRGTEIFKLSANQVAQAKALPVKEKSGSAAHERRLHKDAAHRDMTAKSASSDSVNSDKAHNVSTKLTTATTQILICQHSSCRKRGSGAVSCAVSDAIATADASSQISIRPIGCVKNCKLGPNVIIRSVKSQAKRGTQAQQLIPADHRTQGQTSAQVSGRYEQVTPTRISRLVETIASTC